MASVFKGIALVTGAAHGIGRAIALRLANDGFHIALNDIPSKKALLDDIAQTVGDKGGRAFAICADVGEEEQVKEMVHGTVKTLGGLDVMVANAGIARVNSLTGTPADVWDKVLRVNARGVYLCYRFAALQMIAQGRGGRIIGASSVAGKRGYIGLGAYSASKFAAGGALELGKHGITVNSYAPGIINTPIWESTFVPSDYTSFEEEKNKYVGDTAVGHVGEPEDIASLVSYLASKEARYVTGQCFSADGGIFLT
ncbi:NAD(P)-binding protein [Leucogyrophana mollusca]|uniref:NAD(P)-binding protein n=1 Tax=Leucogyrophana mollusca TaxID=85980 RepID=A0ACB8BHE5_9AGAM|nr:NAD(P)-binding protein [Leucogyrophana mollusca]